MMSFLAPKGLRAEVTEGIDLENAVMLSGQRVTVGSGPGDTLRLGAADIVPGHLTFERRADGRGWDYFTSDRGVTQIDKGNPRTGQVRAGMWLRLGRETRVDLSRAPLPAASEGEKVDQGEPATVPMPIALGILGAIVFGAFVASGGLGGASDQRTYRTAQWAAGAGDLDSALDACLSKSVSLNRAVAASDPASAFWRVMTLRNTDASAAKTARGDLQSEIQEILADAHLLSLENNDLAASQTLRRLEYVLPVGSENCPILTASRFDLALMEVRGSR